MQFKLNNRPLFLFFFHQTTIPSYFTYNECTDGSSACTYYSVRIGPNADNDSFVDFYLETSAKGYAAVGFSKNRKMVLSLVTQLNLIIFRKIYPLCYRCFIHIVRRHRSLCLEVEVVWWVTRVFFTRTVWLNTGRAVAFDVTLNAWTQR